MICLDNQRDALTPTAFANSNLGLPQPQVNERWRLGTLKAFVNNNNFANAFSVV